MSNNMSGTNIGQVQSIVTKTVAGNTQPTIITMSSTQPQHQILTPNLNTVKMELDPNIKTQMAPVATMHPGHQHGTQYVTSQAQSVLANQHVVASTSPSPGLGNLQSINSNLVTATTSSASTAHSPLVSSLQQSATSPSPAPQVKNMSAPSPANSQHDSTSQILTRPRLQDLIREVDTAEQLDEEVEEILLQLADDFVDSTVGAACLLAKHRRSTTLEVKDVQLHLERHWNMWLPGFGTDELRPYKRSVVTEAHKQRLALIRKALKKY